jgi:hypothetical protein
LFYFWRGSHKFFLEETLKIYTDKDDIAEMPEHVLIKTKNLDFIRQLFREGKRVSWYEPDIARFARYFVQFDFEHLFIRLFTFHGIVYPTGETLPEKDEFGKYNFNFDKENRKQYRITKWQRKIGYHRKALDERVNKYWMYRLEHIKYSKGIAASFKPRIRGHYLLWYYNMLSLTYMICNKSIVATAKTKGALKG